MGRIGNIVRDFIRREEALSASEYAVMLALIVCLCMGPIQTLGCSANRSFTNTSSSINGS